MVVFQTKMDLWIRTGTEHEAGGRVHEAPSLETDSHGGRDTLHCTAQSGHQRRRPALWRTLNKSAVHCRPSEVKGSRHSLVTGTVAASARLSPPPPPHRPTSHYIPLHWTGSESSRHRSSSHLWGPCFDWTTQGLADTTVKQGRQTWRGKKRNSNNKMSKPKPQKKKKKSTWIYRERIHFMD